MRPKTNDYVGEIINFEGSWNSGLAMLIVKNKNGKIIRIPCDNAPTVRALDSMFNNVITKNHAVNIDAIKGKTIEYEIDDFGVLAWIKPMP